MKALLMHPQQDFDPRQPLPPQAPALAQDLELDTLWQAMADGDDVVQDVVRQAMLSAMANDAATILHRQAVLRDGLREPARVRELHALAQEAVEGRRKYHLGIFMNYPSSVLRSSIEMMQFYVGMLTRLRAFADAHAARFESAGFTHLFAMLRAEFSDDYIARIHSHLAELKFDAGVLLSAELGAGNEGTHHVLRLLRDKRPNWLKRLFAAGPPTYSFHIADRDEAGARALSQLQDRGINGVANALAQSTEHIVSFFEMLRTELAFYVGALNLNDRLVQRGAPICLPEALAPGSQGLRCADLRDACLVLKLPQPVVGNTVDADGRGLVVITGANQGGKSSFLRAIGVAHLMMHSGLFVTAQSFAAERCAGLFTHYKREEDAGMKSGRLDEELARLGEIADTITPGCLLLCNESFASTNEREGSEIARQTVLAMRERRIKVFFVTHLYDFAHALRAQHRPDTLFLRAERRDDGTRGFRLVPGDPLSTSYGKDLYAQVFAADLPTPLEASAPPPGPRRAAGPTPMTTDAPPSPGGRWADPHVE